MKSFKWVCWRKQDLSIVYDDDTKSLTDVYKSIHPIPTNLPVLLPHSAPSSAQVKSRPPPLLSPVPVLKSKSTPTPKTLKSVPEVQDGNPSAPSQTARKKTPSPRNPGREKNYPCELLPQHPQNV